MKVKRTLTYHFHQFCNYECLEESIVFIDEKTSFVYIVPHSLLGSFMNSEYHDSFRPINCDISDIFREMYDDSFVISNL